MLHYNHSNHSNHSNYPDSFAVLDLYSDMPVYCNHLIQFLDWGTQFKN